MTINEELWDRTIRLLVGVALGYAAWSFWPGITGIAFLVIGAVALLTAATGWCPGYSLFDFSTRKRPA